MKLEARIQVFMGQALLENMRLLARIDELTETISKLEAELDRVRHPEKEPDETPDEA